jgi:DNA-binding response OmpR family regulator
MSLSVEPVAAPSATVRRIWGYVLSLVLVGLAGWSAILVDQLVGASNLSLIFVLPVVVAAVNFGWGPALLAAVTGVATFNFLLIEPRYSFRVEDPANAWPRGLLLVVAAIVSSVAAQSRRRALEAAERADQAMALHALARALAGASDRASITRAAAEALTRLFHAGLRHGVQVRGSAPVVQAGALEIDLGLRTVVLAGEPVRLSPKEYDLLSELALNLGRTLSHAELLEAVWGGARADIQYLRVYVGQLRHKLGAERILSEPGVGYRLHVD